MKKLAIKEIKALLQEAGLSDEEIDALREDERKGVQSLLKQYDRQKEKALQLQAQFIQMQQFDQQFMKTAQDHIAGVDEAGRGPLAGPVVSAAVILPSDFTLIGLNDSKQLTAEKRAEFDQTIKAQAISYHIALVDHQTIDQINIFEATKKSMTEALMHLEVRPTIALIDAVKLPQLPFPTKEIIKGDAHSIAIAAASILAKVARDQIMDDIDKIYPQYDLAHNKGYGTKKHLEALQKYGPSPYHRLTFAPVQQSLR